MIRIRRRFQDKKKDARYFKFGGQVYDKTKMTTEEKLVLARKIVNQDKRVAEILKGSKIK